ncbi:hypothetical protein GCK32_008810, partial [Trichostrongylus colubriformis]
MQVHANKILQMVDNAQCCNCRKRWQLAILANIGFMIVFGIRCNFGAAKNHMFRNYTDPWGRSHVHDFNWTRAELSVMESSFFYGYLVTQIPAGFLAAKYPPNKLFGIAIGVASFLNILLPFGFKSKSDTLVAVIQILQGLVQGVAYPSMHGVWRYWAPPLERSKLATTAFTGSYAGAVLGLPVSAFLVSYVGWSAPFYLYGFAGVIWAVFWFSLTFEKPAFHPTITQEEKKYIEDAIGHVSATHPTFSSIPWKAIVTSKPVWAIIVANFARSWTFYLLLQNQLTYMKEALNINISDSGFLAALPHAVMGIVVLFGGQLADYLRSHKILSTTAVRKIFNCGGFGGEALFMLIVAYTNKESTAILALILAVGCSGFAISGFNVNHLDIAPRYAAILMGFSNGIGTLAGLTCPIVTEKFTENGAHGWVKDWAEPKPEEETWNVTALNNRTSNAGYGATKGEVPISLAPLPTAGQISQGQPPPVATDPGIPTGTNPFVAAWDTPAPAGSSPYQQQCCFDKKAPNSCNSHWPTNVCRVSFQGHDSPSFANCSACNTSGCGSVDHNSPGFVHLKFLEAGQDFFKIFQGKRSELPRPLQTAQMNAIPLSAAATSIAQGTSFAFSYLNSHLNARDTSYTENLSVSITNPTGQIASVTITSSYVNFTTMNFMVGGGEVKTMSITPADIQTDYMDQYLQFAIIENKVLFIDSNVTISVIASNSLSGGGGEDKFVVLPVRLNYLYTTPTVLNRGQQLTIATYYTQTTVAVTSDKPVAVIS